LQEDLGDSDLLSILEEENE
jgi:hypothetical protein